MSSHVIFNFLSGITVNSEESQMRHNETHLHATTHAHTHAHTELGEQAGPEPIVQETWET